MKYVLAIAKQLTFGEITSIVIVVGVPTVLLYHAITRGGIL